MLYNQDELKKLARSFISTDGDDVEFMSINEALCTQMEDDGHPLDNDEQIDEMCQAIDKLINTARVLIYWNEEDSE